VASDFLDSDDGSRFREGHGRRLDLDSGSHGRLGSSGLVLDGDGFEDGRLGDRDVGYEERLLRPEGSKSD